MADLKKLVAIADELGLSGSDRAAFFSPLPVRKENWSLRLYPSANRRIVIEHCLSRSKKRPKTNASMSRSKQLKKLKKHSGYVSLKCSMN